MSTPAVYLIAPESAIVDACRGWKPASKEPVRRSAVNPFTSEEVELLTHVPPGVDESMDCAGVDEVLGILRQVKPLAADVIVPPGWGEVLHETVPFLYGFDEKYEGRQSIVRVPIAREQEVIDCFTADIGELRNEAFRREQNLRVFIFWHPEEISDSHNLSASYSPESSPTEIVEAWIELFNRGDVDGLCELYAEDATNHQVVTEPLVGRQAIRRMFETEFARAEMTCIKESIFEDGEWAILEWSAPTGLRGCGFFHIQNGKIVFQRGYFDQLTFFRLQGIPIPDSYLGGT